VSDQPAEVREDGPESGPTTDTQPPDIHPPGARRAIRLAIALVVVWGLSLGAFAIHLTGPLALIWLILAIYYLPLGSRVSDRIMAIAALGAAAVSLIAWVGPQVPPLMHPVTLTGVLGTAPAVVWARRGTPRIRPKFPRSDWVALTCGLVAGFLWWLPLRASQTAELISALFFASDTASHLGMIRGVWNNHGYEIVHVGSGSGVDYRWQTYPQGAQADLAAVGSVVMSEAMAPEVNPLLRLYAVLLASLAGFLAFALAWAVARITHRYAAKRPISQSVGMLVTPVILVVGPGAWILMSSVSLVAGFITLILALVTAVTTDRHPRRGALLVTAGSIATCAAYPLLGLFVPLVWLAFLWFTRSYWMARFRLAVVVTALAALLCAPMFIMIVVRDVDHGLDAAGGFEKLPIPLLIVVVLLLAGVLAAGRARVPRPIRALTWITAATLACWSSLAISNWVAGGAVNYYATKMMYPSVLLALVAIASTCVARTRPEERASPNPARHRRAQVLAMAAGALLLGTSLLGSVSLIANERGSSTGTWWTVAPGGIWVTGNTYLPRFGSVLVDAVDRTESPLEVTLFVPCHVELGRWAGALTDHRQESDTMLYLLSCDPNDLADFLELDPKLRVDVFARNVQAYRELEQLKAEHNLRNLNLHLIEGESAS